MPDDLPTYVVTGIHTQTSIYVREEDGERFPFFSLECFVGPDAIPGPTLLFDMPLSIGIMGDIIKMMKTVYGISDMPVDPNQLEIPFDPEAYGTPPDDPNDYREPPDRTGDR